MKYPVRVYEVERTTGAPEKPRFMTEFLIFAPTLEKCRKLVIDKLDKSGHELRTLSFSPDPAPHGSVVCYVWKGDHPDRAQQMVGGRAKRRRGRQ